MTQEETRERMRLILEEYAEALEAAVLRRRTSLVPWIFQSAVPHDLYLGQVMTVLNEACQVATAETLAAMSDRIGWECSCRCFPHGRIACPRCVRVAGCMVHKEI